jgi:hypothetical protein
VTGDPTLTGKLNDWLLLDRYREWLTAHGLQDADHLLDFATEALTSAPRHLHGPARFGGLWLTVSPK